MRQSFGEWSLKKGKVREELVVEELEGDEVQGGRVEENEDAEEKRWGFDPLE
jgi:hypothetical protein